MQKNDMNNGERQQNSYFCRRIWSSIDAKDVSSSRNDGPFDFFKC